ncbi:MAG: long-chain-acyl-CoA synthetase [Acetobacteraceae bacterium]|nr:long-chain-acyl-CoA synthetase [Acetobacteraceae bacterium]
MTPARGDALKAWIRALDAITIMETAPGTTLPGLLDGLAATHGERPALLGEGDALSYRDLAARVNRVARWAIARGLAPGDAVGLLMPNCPDYVAIWLGLTRAGCAVALINTHLTDEPLLHCIRAAAPARLIVAAALLPAVAALAGRLPPDLGIDVHGAPAGTAPPLGQRIEPDLARHDGSPLAATERAPPAPRDQALLIYTSGTTGMPKAARVTHARIVEWSFWFAGMMDIQPDDRLYDCLPLYHSTGGIVAIGALLARGGSVLIRARFSASRFWDDVADGGCTIFQYIGELCRILAASPPHPREQGHRLRLACGNGLQGDVWAAFQQRFGIPRILEFYAATEGSVSLYNCEGKPGAIGRVPPFLAHRFPVALIRCDAETATPSRDAEGLCVACGPDEIGEAIGPLPDAPDAPARRFDGYTDAAASAGKVLRDVFKKGDRWFRTGDLMRRDAAGYFFFVDRIGDTFRWKGENVATTEVAGVLRACPGITDAVVYGVAVPGHEGRAGMAAVTTDERFDLAALHAHLAARLPAYARPLFLRRCDTIDATGTFKPIKGRLAREAYADTSDPVWFNDRDAGGFVVCDAALLQAIADGRRRL